MQIKIYNLGDLFHEDSQASSKREKLHGEKNGEKGGRGFLRALEAVNEEAALRNSSARRMGTEKPDR